MSSRQLRVPVPAGRQLALITKERATDARPCLQRTNVQEKGLVFTEGDDWEQDVNARTSPVSSCISESLATVQKLLPRPLPSSPQSSHGGDVNCVGVSSDGIYVASAGDDHRKSLEVNGIAWLQRFGDVRDIAVGCGDGSVSIWSLTGCPGSNQMIVSRQFDQEVEAVQYDPASDRLLVMFDAAIAIWALKDYRRRDSTYGIGPNILFSSSIGGAGFLAAGTICIVSLPRKGRLLMLSVEDETLTLTRVFSAPYQPHYITVSQDGLVFAVGGLDGSIHVYDWLGKGDPVEKALLQYPRCFIIPRAITFSFIHGARFLLVGGEEETALVLDLMNGQQVATLKHQPGSYILAVTATSDLEVVRMITASSYGRNYVVLWECLLSDMTTIGASLTGDISVRASGQRGYSSWKVWRQTIAAPLSVATLVAIVLYFLINGTFRSRCRDLYEGLTVCIGMAGATLLVQVGELTKSMGIIHYIA